MSDYHVPPEVLAKIDKAVREWDFYRNDRTGQFGPNIGCLAGCPGCGCNSLYGKYADKGGQEYFLAALNTHGRRRAEHE